LAKRISEERQFRQIVDLSVELKSLDTPVFPGAPQPLRATIQTHEEDGYLSYTWSFSEHTATHIDAPAHMVKGGATIDKVPLDRFVGNGLVLDLSDKPNNHRISVVDLERAMAAAGRNDRSWKGWVLLLYTGYTAKNRSPEWLKYPDLTKEACEFIARMGFSAVGLDSPSPDKHPYIAHKTLLPRNVAIYENLANLEKVMGRRFLFVGLPLLLVGGSASPCRAVALVM
jgi:arylformamidase